MFCPKCRYEYRPDITKCPDCDIWLVRDLPPDPELEPEPDEKLLAENLVTVCEISDSAALQIAKALLDEAGIEYLVKNENPRTAVMLPHPTSQPFEIQVLPDDFDHATEILMSMEEEGEPEPSEEDSTNSSPGV